MKTTSDPQVSVGERVPAPPKTESIPGKSVWRDKHGLALPLRIGIAVAAVILAGVLIGGLDKHTTYVLSAVLAAALVASSLNLVVGYTGQLNLSAGAFLALGAYIGVIGTGRLDWSGLQSLAVTAGVALAISGLLGLVIFRTKGLHFALITAGLSIIAYNVVLAWKSQTGGAAGLSSAGPVEEGGIARPFTLGPIELSDGSDYLFAMIVVLVLIMLGTTVVTRRKTGLSWQAVRDDEVLAASVGVQVGNAKKTAFIASSVLIAMIGVLYGHWLGYITPGSFDFTVASFEPLAMVVIGGSGTIAGPLIGAAIIAGVPEASRELDNYSTLIYAVVLLFVVLVAPKGIMGVFHATVATVKKSVAARRSQNGD
ncbi:branched-chain amino acid ABC transporter permease [Rhodococcus sp. C26F]